MREAPIYTLSSFGLQLTQRIIQFGFHLSTGQAFSQLGTRFKSFIIAYTQKLLEFWQFFNKNKIRVTFSVGHVILSVMYMVLIVRQLKVLKRSFRNQKSNIRYRSEVYLSEVISLEMQRDFCTIQT